MSRTFAVIKREFTESVRTKMFIIMTLFGPLLMVGFVALEVAMMRSGGGEKALTIVDATPAAVGSRVAQMLQAASPGEKASDRTTFKVDVVELTGKDAAAVRNELQGRIDRKEIDGYLWLPAGGLASEPAMYVGRSATNMGLVEQLRGSVQGAVQSVRLADQGIDPRRLGEALRPVSLETRKAASGAAQGSGTALFFLGYTLGMVVYLVIIIFGMAVMRGVLEEKKDRIVEVVVSSIRARQLMLGKVLGIGGASLVQVAVWAGFAALTLHYGPQVMARLGAPGMTMPQVPGSVAGIFLLYFAGGFFLYASLYAALGAMAASDQDMQQLQLPGTMILLLSYMVMFRAMTDPEGQLAVISSWVPFSSPMVMPIRSALTAVSPLEMAGSFATLILGGLLIIWVGGKIYRVGILATGKKPSMAELVRWVRAA